MPTPLQLSLAPIRGLTDAPFRNLFCKHFQGFDFSITPFINPMKDPSPKAFKDVFPEANTGFPIIPQILSNDAESFLATAQILADMGYTEANWNLGCPAPMVTKKKRGSGLLADGDRIVRILDDITPKLPLQISIKTRLGFSAVDETLNLLPRLNDFPLSEIIIHTRLGKQLYRGITDPDSFELFLNHTTHRLSYNGDITDIDIFNDLHARFPNVQHWMIGRGAIADPFLPEKIKGIHSDDASTRLHRLTLFHDELVEMIRSQLSGSSHILGRLKMLWTYLGNSFPENKKELKKIRKAATEEQYLEAVHSLLARQ